METPVRADRPRMRAKTKKMDAVPEPRVTRGCHGGIAHSRGGVDGRFRKIMGNFFGWRTGFRCLPRKWRLEALVDFDLVAGDKLVGLIGHANDGLKLLEHGPGHAFAESGSGVRGDAVSAVVGDAHRDVDHFLGEWIERARRHELLDAFPRALEQCGIVGDGLPEIIDPVGFARGHDVVVNGAHFRASVTVFDESECGHENLRNHDCELRPQVSRNWRDRPVDDRPAIFQHILKRQAAQNLQEYLTRDPSAAFAEDEIYWSSG